MLGDISRGGNFHYTAPISFIKASGFYFCVVVIFAKKTKARKTRKLSPRENIHFYSTLKYDKYSHESNNDIDNNKDDIRDSVVVFTHLFIHF